jgi:predicted nucleotidyltransferase
MPGTGDSSGIDMSSRGRTAPLDGQIAVFVEKIRACMPELRARYKVKSLGVFGSYVRGHQEDASDLDILVDFEEPPSLFEFVRLEMYLSELLGVDVDLVMRSALKPRIGERILEQLVSV